MSKIKITRSGIINLALASLLLIIVFNPDAKATIMNGLMKIGLFSPDVSAKPPKEVLGMEEIMFQDGKGKTISLSALKGKVVFINFWATWCPPCRAEMPSLNKLHSTFSNNEKAVFITVDADGNHQKAQKFLDKKKYRLPLYTIASNIPSDLFSGTLPTTVIIDKSGKLVFRHEGAADYADQKFVDFLEKLTRE